MLAPHDRQGHNPRPELRPHVTYDFFYLIFLVLILMEVEDKEDPY